MTNETFKANRIQLGLTQVELSKILHLSERQIARYDNGQSDPPGPVQIIMGGLLTGHWPRLTARQKRKKEEKTGFRGN